MQAVDLTGKRFERWIVLNRSIEQKSGGHCSWHCLCDCGKERLVSGASLRNGRSKSCGCRTKEIVRKLHQIEFGLSAKRRAFQPMKNRYKKHHLEFDITFDKFLELSAKPCHYCGIERSNKCTGLNGDFLYNGLDRVDNSKGYLVTNVVPCCDQCNTAKNSLSLEEFKAWIEIVYKQMCP